MSSIIGEYSPYPYGFRGDIKKRACCELSMGGMSRFIIIRPKSYFPIDSFDREIYFIKKGF